MECHYFGKAVWPGFWFEPKIELTLFIDFIQNPLYINDQGIA